MSGFMLTYKVCGLLVVWVYICFYCVKVENHVISEIESEVNI